MTPATRMSAEDRRQAVVEAALREFAHGGLDGTSTEAIAKRAGISQPYVFRLFPTKKDLFVAAVTAGFARVAAAFEEAADGLAGEEAFAAMGQRYAELLRDRDLLLAQLHAYAGCDDPDVRAATRAAYGRLWQLVARVSGADEARVAEFFAAGMLISVAAAMDLPGLAEPWAQAAVRHVCPDGLPG
jgi:AcrR family transcriptional regulator